MCSLNRYSSLLALIPLFIGCSPADTGSTDLDGITGDGTGTGMGGGGAAAPGAGGGAVNGGGAITGVVFTQACGNGELVEGEECDDGNNVTGDGCTQACQLEVDWVCPVPGEPCVSSALCGDGLLSSLEACDDTNTNPGDGCSADCMVVEEGWQCRLPGAACIPLCGNGVITPPENCDDGNVVSGDGCSSTCLEEPGWSCEGAVCTKSVCGNGILETGEGCDAGPDNGLFFGNGLGCSKTCTMEPSCRDATGATVKCATVCGDANIDVGEECDDGNLISGDGCSAACTNEPGFTCTEVEFADTTPCPSGVGECLVLPIVYRDFDGAHVADTGHPDFFFMGAGDVVCVPNASGVAATPSNGSCYTSDAVDLCPGLVESTLGPGGKPVANVAGGLSCDCRFTDWDGTGILSGVAAQSCTDNGGFTHPWYSTTTQVIESAASFDEWYNDSVRGTMVRGTLPLANLAGTNQYQFSSSDGQTVYDDLHEIFLTGSGMLDSGFFPLETQTAAGGNKLCNLWPYWVVPAGVACRTGGASGVDKQWDPQGSYDRNAPNGDGGPIPGDGTSATGVVGMDRNFYFTSEVRYLFRYAGGESLSFFGDDDVWVFINGQLVLDLGAPHERLQGTVQLTDAGGTYTIEAINVATGLSTPVATGAVPALGLEVGGTYEIAVFHADRHPRESNYQLTLSGFSTKQSQCIPRCGDGVIATGEECDNGELNSDVVYNGCTTQCKFGPFCGDGVVDFPIEPCDLGRDNTSRYGDSTGCGPGCTVPHYCGDGIIDSAFQEECDDGGPSAGCNEACKLTII